MLKLNDAEMRDLLEQVTALTKAGSLQWGDMGTKYWFAAYTDRFSFYIRSIDSDDSHPIEFEVDTRGENRINVGRISSDDVEGSTLAMLLSLYLNVKIVILGIKDIREEIAEDLRNIAIRPRQT